MEGYLLNEIDKELHVWSSVKDNELRNIRSTKMRSILRGSLSFVILDLVATWKEVTKPARQKSMVILFVNDFKLTK